MRRGCQQEAQLNGHMTPCAPTRRLAVSLHSPLNVDFYRHARHRGTLVQSNKWGYAPRRLQHPCFTTSNYAYGMKSPTKADMPMTWHGAKGEFTKTFAGITRDQGLRCHLETSRVHHAFDQM
jgi:hypothetical protein